LFFFLLPIRQNQWDSTYLQNGSLFLTPIEATESALNDICCGVFCGQSVCKKKKKKIKKTVFQKKYLKEKTKKTNNA